MDCESARGEGENTVDWFLANFALRVFLKFCMPFVLFIVGLLVLSVAVLVVNHYWPLNPDPVCTCKNR
jgi:hypothetical protein